MKKALGIFIRVTLLLLTCYLILTFVTYVVLPSKEQWLQSHTLSTALSGARSVTIIEFTPYYFDADAQTIVQHEVVLKRVIAKEEQIGQLRSATARFVVFRDSYQITGCFTPHHRVEVVRSDGSVFRFDVCFECRKFSFDKHYDEVLPPEWLPLLRQFFTGLGMPPRTDAEYLRLAQEKIKAQLHFPSH